MFRSLLKLFQLSLGKFTTICKSTTRKYTQFDVTSVENYCFKIRWRLKLDQCQLKEASAAEKELPPKSRTESQSSKIKEDGGIREKESMTCIDYNSRIILSSRDNDDLPSRENQRIYVWA